MRRVKADFPGTCRGAILGLILADEPPASVDVFRSHWGISLKPPLLSSARGYYLVSNVEFMQSRTGQQILANFSGAHPD